MFNRNFLAAAILPFVFFLNAFSQTPEKVAPEAKLAEIRKEAVQFLRETSADANTLRTLENRISFASEMAGLMWFENEKEARAMYQTVIADFKQLLAGYDAQMTALGITPDRNASRGGFLGGGEDESEKSKLSLKFSKAMGVRRQIALSLAEHEPQLAFGFFTDTLLIISNAEFRGQIEKDDVAFEVQLLKEIAKNDPSKAVEYGRKNLAAGVNYQHLDLVNKLYEKDAEKGAELAAEIVRKIKSQKPDPDNLYLIKTFLQTGAATIEKAKKDGKKPMLTEQELRDLAEALARGVLERREPEWDYSSYIGVIERYAPSRAAQIRAKFPAKPESKTSVATVGMTDEQTVRSISTDGKSPEDEKKAQEEALRDLQKLATKQLPPEERAQIIEKSRKIINEMPTRQAKITALSALAVQVVKLGDKELAAEIMREAQSLVNPAPKNYRDYLEVWMLINGLAETEPEKAFPVLEETIFRLNDTLSGFIKVAEFIDVSGEIIDDGEVQVGAFGGSIIREMTAGLGMADGLIRNLTLADFGKMKAVTNRFERTEIRVLAKMLVLRAILGGEKKNKIEDVEIPTDE